MNKLNRWIVVVGFFAIFQNVLQADDAPKSKVEASAEAKAEVVPDSVKMNRFGHGPAWDYSK